MKTSTAKRLTLLKNGAFTQTTNQELLLKTEVDFSEGTYISGLL